MEKQPGKSLDYRSFLRLALQIRQAKNPAYSVGSFGRLLGISASRAAQILKGKVGISVQRAVGIAEALGFSEQDKKMFILLVQSEHERNPQIRNEAIKKLEEIEDGYDDVSDVFHSIADWHNHAVRELISINNPEDHDKSIPLKLGISVDAYKTSIERLLNLGLIECIPQTIPQRYRVKQRGIRTRQDVPSEAVKTLNEQVLSKAKDELRRQDILDRDYSIVFFKFDKAQVPLVKEKIARFRRELMQELEISETKDSVYCMSIQFFELTGNENKK